MLPPPPIPVMTMVPPIYGTSPREHAGFWLRFVAIIIDYIILTVFVLLLALPFGVFAGLEKFSDSPGRLVINLVNMVVYLFYFSLMESSPTQGTLGKMALGLVVTDMNGRQLTFAQALLRTLAKILSGCICYIGFIMAGFTEKKQGLHDLITGCLVERKARY
jgi:uncharacterized RDD family membrane protein YckC